MECVLERIEMSQKITLQAKRLEGVKIGSVRGMLVYLEGDVGDETIFVNVYRSGKTKHGTYQQIADLSLSKEYFKNAYHVDLMRVDHRFQGHGLAPLIYRYIMKKLGIIIQAGTMQSAGGRKLWAQLAKTKGVAIFAAYRRSKELVRIELDKEDEELHHESIKMYDGPRSVYTFAMAM